MKIFGTDGIRGEAYKELTLDLAHKVGQSLSLLKCQRVIIACDTRESSEDIVSEVASGACSQGLQVQLAGILPTPGLMRHSLKENMIGVMVTASHNPYQDNGIKVFLNGYKISEEQEKVLEEAIAKNRFKSPKLGTIVTTSDPYLDYVAFLHELARNTELKIGIDAANGATYQVAQDVFTGLSNHIYFTGIKPNGKNINDKVGSTHLDHIKEFVKTNQCDIGFSFDGDGDRVLVVDENGERYDGDQLVYILAQYLKTHRRLPFETVVLSIMSNVGMIKALSNKGINVETTPVGDKYILQAIREKGYAIGGENSGHIIMREIQETGDGLAIALTLISVLQESNRSLKEWLSDVVMYPDKMVNLKMKNKQLIHHPEVQKSIENVKQELGADGKVIVRASGTENLVRVSVMAPSLELVNTHVERLTGLLMMLDMKEENA